MTKQNTLTISPAVIEHEAQERIRDAAPDLLAALENMLGPNPQYHKARAAIDKARPQATSSYLNRPKRTFEQAVRDSES